MYTYIFSGSLRFAGISFSGSESSPRRTPLCSMAQHLAKVGHAIFFEPLACCCVSVSTPLNRCSHSNSSWVTLTSNHMLLCSDLTHPPSHPLPFHLRSRVRAPLPSLIPSCGYTPATTLRARLCATNAHAGLCHQPHAASRLSSVTL